MNEDEIFNRLRDILVENFEIDAATVVPESNLFQDLGLDSIDAVDLAINVQKLTGKRIKPDDFKHVRTVADMVSTARKLLAE